MEGFVGWSAKKTEKVGFFQCPSCSHMAVMLSSEISDGIHLGYCVSCKTKFPKEDFKIVEKVMPAVECASCESTISLTPDYLTHNGLGYACPKCESYVALIYDDKLINPPEIFNPFWNKNNKRKYFPLEGDANFFICETEKDRLIARVLTSVAKSENTEFLSFADVQDAGIICRDDEYLGYIIWHIKEEDIILRQVFVVEKERGRGIATSAIKCWVEEIANKKSGKFGIESPNGIVQRILVKLGYAKSEKETIRGIKCFFTGA